MDISELQHESITDDNRESFAKHMEKFDSLESAALDGMALKKMTGQPFRLPESMDKLDDNTRADFTAKAPGLLGIQPGVSKIEDLADINFAEGMAEGAQADDNIAGMLKNIAIEKKWPASVVKDLVGLYNGPLTEYGIKALETKQFNDNLAKKTETNAALIAHPSIGSQEKLNSLSEDMRRVFQNKAGLNAVEYEQVGNALAESILTSDPVLARAMLTVLAPLAQNAKHENGDGRPAPTKEISEADKRVKKTLGWV